MPSHPADKPPVPDGLVSDELKRAMAVEDYLDEARTPRPHPFAQPQHCGGSGEPCERCKFQRNFAVLNSWLDDEYSNAYGERFAGADSSGTSSAADGRAQAFLDVSRFINSHPSLAEGATCPNVLSQEEAQLVVRALLPAISGTPEAALSDRLGDFAFPDDDEPYKPHPATVPGGTYLPPDARPDSTGLPEFGELPKPEPEVGEKRRAIEVEWTARACPEHGLSGQESHCFWCRKPLETVAVMPVSDHEAVRAQWAADLQRATDEIGSLEDCADRAADRAAEAEKKLEEVEAERDSARKFHTAEHHDRREAERELAAFEQALTSHKAMEAISAALAERGVESGSIKGLWPDQALAAIQAAIQTAKEKATVSRNQGSEA